MVKKYKTNISNNALVTLVESVISNCNGVSEQFYSNKKRNRRNKRIEINNRNNNLSIDVHVYAYYGHKIAEAISYLQENIPTVIEEKTDYKVKEVNVYVDGFIEDNREKPVLEIEQPKIKNAIIATVQGDGLVKLFLDSKIDGAVSIENPQMQDYLDAINKVDAENIFILPSNIKEYGIANSCKDEIKNKNLYIVDTKSPLEEINAINCFDRTLETNDILHRMKEEISKVTSYGFYLVDSDAVFENKTVKQGNYIGISNESLICHGKSYKRTLSRLIDDILEVRHKECLTIIVGKDADEKITKKICKYVKDYSCLTTKLIVGNQDKYIYLFGLE
ncbi:MAG: Asp23/Gls24 family envelope stress response protein [Erysipelotrichaceae bacterium]|nr:Asp23/Gls24 family envelope stress response protein [Erysipelotrichaceae bacterium]